VRFIAEDIDLIKHLLGILVNDSEPLTAQNKLLVQQLNIHILKVLTNMINVGGAKVLDTLQREGLLEIFVNYLYRSQSSSSKDKNLIPVEWLELKCS
jgi:hypothetical protein